MNSTNRTFGLKKGNVVGRLIEIDPDDIREIEEDQTNGGVINVSSEYKDAVELTATNSDLFAEKDTELGRTKLFEVTVNTGDHPPIALITYRTPIK